LRYSIRNAFDHGLFRDHLFLVALRALRSHEDDQQNAEEHGINGLEEREQ
jgi:hypothetical protein